MFAERGETLSVVIHHVPTYQALNMWERDMTMFVELGQLETLSSCLTSAHVLQSQLISLFASHAYLIYSVCRTSSSEHTIRDDRSSCALLSSASCCHSSMKIVFCSDMCTRLNLDRVSTRAATMVR